MHVNGQHFPITRSAAQTGQQSTIQRLMDGRILLDARAVKDAISIQKTNRGQYAVTVNDQHHLFSRAEMARLQINARDGKGAIRIGKQVDLPIQARLGRGKNRILNPSKKPALSQHRASLQHIRGGGAPPLRSPDPISPMGSSNLLAPDAIRGLENLDGNKGWDPSRRQDALQGSFWNPLGFLHENAMGSAAKGTGHPKDFTTGGGTWSCCFIVCPSAFKLDATAALLSSGSRI